MLPLSMFIYLICFMHSWVVNVNTFSPSGQKWTLTWTSLGSAGTGLQPILDHRCRIRWYISRKDNSCHKVSPGRREWRVPSKTKHRTPGICWNPAGHCGWPLWVQGERVQSNISTQDPFFSRSSKPSKKTGAFRSALGLKPRQLRLFQLSQRSPAYLLSVIHSRIKAKRSPLAKL